MHSENKVSEDFPIRNPLLDPNNKHSDVEEINKDFFTIQSF